MWSSLFSRRLKFKDEDWYISHKNGRPLKVFGPGRPWFGRGSLERVENPIRLSFLLLWDGKSFKPDGLRFQELTDKQAALVKWRDEKLAWQQEYRYNSFWYLPRADVEVRVFTFDGPREAKNYEQEFPFRAATPKWLSAIWQLKIPSSLSLIVDRGMLFCFDVGGSEPPVWKKVSENGLVEVDSPVELRRILAAPGAAKYLCWTVVEPGERWVLNTLAGPAVLREGLNAWWRGLLIDRPELETLHKTEESKSNTIKPSGGEEVDSLERLKEAAITPKVVCYDVSDLGDDDSAQSKDGGVSMTDPTTLPES